MTKQYTGENHTDEVCGSLSRLIVQVALEYLPRGCEATWPRKAEEGEAGVGAGATLNALACACSCSALPKGSAQACGVQRGCGGRSKAAQSDSSENSSAPTALSSANSRSLRAWAGRGASAAHFGLMLGHLRIFVQPSTVRPGAVRCGASPARGVADHPRVEFMHLGASRSEASPADSVADHPLVGLVHLGAVRNEASPADSVADHPWVEFESKILPKMFACWNSCSL